MNRLIEYTVFSGLVTACRLATCPTSRSPPLVIATTEGVVRAPSWFGITTGSPPCITATTELVVPRSIPIILLIARFLPNSLQKVFAKLAKHFSHAQAEKAACGTGCATRQGDLFTVGRSRARTQG